MDVNIGDILDDLEADMRAPDASGLSAKQLVEELQARGLKPTGFPEDDIKLLQKQLNAEFEAEKADKIKERREALMRRKAEEDAMRMQRFVEKQVRSLSRSHTPLPPSPSLLTFHPPPTHPPA
jgi:hypothetical protein